ncbi:MAG: membrane dipeptidase [Chloroflexi bacterium]|nr:membrane dipeptidase [Chloroflexota bacterium]
MLIIDAHLDLAWNAMQWSRDLLQSVYTLRAREGRMSGDGRGQNTVSLPELRRGHVALCFGTVLARVNERGVPDIDYASPAQAYAAARGHVAYYHALAQQGSIRLITSRTLLDAHLAEWEAWAKTKDDAAQGVASGRRKDEWSTGDSPSSFIPHPSSFVSPSSFQTPPTGVVISMECADPIMFPDQVAEWYDAGLRLIGPGHYGRGRYVGGTGTDVGFNEAGIQLLNAMERSGIILDVTHLSDEAFWEAMSLYDGPILASHHNCRALAPHQRQLSDEQIRALIQRDAVIGAAFDVWMLIPDWSFGKSSNKQVTIATVAEHIDHVCQIAGDSLHAAIGSDLDGGFGRESAPFDLDTIADVQRLAEALTEHNFADDDIANVMYQNWLRLLRRAWREG